MVIKCYYFSLTKSSWLIATPWTAAHRLRCLSFSLSFLKFMSIESGVPSNYLILCCPFFLLPSIFPRIKIFPSELAPCIRWPKYWSFSFSIRPSNDYSGLVSFRIDWFISLQSKGLLRVFFSPTGWKHQFFGAQPSLWSNSHIHTWLLKKPYLDYMDLCLQSNVSAFKYSI